MKRRDLFLLGLMILIALALNIVSFFNLKQLMLLLDERHSLYNLRKELGNLLSDLKDAETGQRGYIITGREDYLGPYNNTLQTIDERLLRIEKGLSSSHEQSLLLQRLISSIQLKLNELKMTIHTRQAEGFETARKEIMSGEGKQFMDNIRAIMDSLISSQSQAIDQQEQAIQNWMRQALWLNILGGGISIFFISLLAYLFGRSNVQLGEMRSQFKQANELFQSMLDDSKFLIITTDPTGIVTNFNKGAEKILGYKAEEVKDQLSILNFYDPMNLQSRLEEVSRKIKPYSEFEAFIASNQFIREEHAEWIMKEKSGRLFSCIQSMTLLRNELSTIQECFFIALDVSNYRKWRQEPQKGQVAMESAQLPQNKFQSHLGHEIPNQISTVEKPFSLNVLIVDNDPDFCALLAAYLQAAGCRVISASTGEEALHLAHSHAIDLITIDMLMSPMNGYEVVQKLKRDPHLRDIPIACISIIAKEIQGKIPSALAYIEKPITQEQVIELLYLCQSSRKAF